MSFSSVTSVFAFSSVQHFAAAAFSELHKVFKFVESAAPVVEAQETLVEGVTAIALGAASPAITIERAAFSALGEIVAAVQAVDDASVAKGTSLTLDAAAITAYKALIAQFKNEFTTLGYGALVKTDPVVAK